MLSSGEVPAFRKLLLGWFREHQRDLPWRRSKDPYRVWLSEIMLQQTRVAAVIPYYQRFLARFPNVAALAAAPEEDVLSLWSGLGYYSRARNLQRAAQHIVAKHHGIFPRTEQEVLALPGIGRYTAAAILSIAFNAKFAALDGNVARVLARLGAVRGDLREPSRWQQLQESADGLLDAESPGDWNQAMMELGAVVCAPHAPQCLLCPLTQFCKARRLGVAESLPEQRRRRESINVSLAAAVLLDPDGRTLLLPPPGSAQKQITKENVAALVSKMWHFPITTVENNAAADLHRFLAKLLPRLTQSQSLQLDSLPKARHAVTFREIIVHPFRIAVRKLPRIPGARIVSLPEITSHSSLAVSNLTRKVARAAATASAR
jgi:A/G-specific adenine glycosylase